MKPVHFVLIIAGLCAEAGAYSQNLTLSMKNVPLHKVFKEIQRQSHYRFIYTQEQLEASVHVSVNVKQENLQNILQQCFKDQPLSYLIEDEFIIIRTREITNDQKPAKPATIAITGKVANEQGEPVWGATVSVRGANKAGSTNEMGIFSLNNVLQDAMLQITCIGYKMQEVKIQRGKILSVQLEIAVNNLDEAVVIGYGTTTKRLNTGSVSRVTAEEISKQAISNPQSALAGRVTGVFVKQQNGLPGSNFTVLIRGQNSIQNGTDPLYVIDGVPFVSNIPMQLNLGLQTGNPFNSVNPGDIESIEILKDADATAIYGSRGANGVILITTKKGKVGKPELEINMFAGWGKITRTADYLNTSEYIQVRKEAFRNDGIIPTINNAPDLMVWDTTRYINWKKLLIGNTAGASNYQVRFSGGNTLTKFSLGLNRYTETTVYPGNFGNKRASVHVNIAQSSTDKKLSAAITANYTSDRNKLVTDDLTRAVDLPPNAPPIYDSVGKLNWKEGNFFFDNPIALTFRRYQIFTDNLISNTIIKYNLLSNLIFKTSIGYNKIQIEEISAYPISSQNPATASTGSASFATNTIKSWIIEPQLDYFIKLNKGLLHTLIGLTYQEEENKKTKTGATGYTNDNMLGSTAGAAYVTSTISGSIYKYGAAFGRLNYNRNDKYFINLTLRRDGSSRFGPEKRFANFGAIGMSWNYSTETFFKKHAGFLSYGKLRGSYGTTGNDQIGNYQYLDAWVRTQFSYQGQTGLRPAKLFNPDYKWEQIRKLEIAWEAAFLQDKILASVNWFLNKSDNQIILVSLPGQTGFLNLLQNFPCVVVNKGLEIELKVSIVNIN